MRSIFRFLGFALVVAAILVLTLFLRNQAAGPANSQAMPGPEQLDQLDAAFVALVSSALPSVVSIDALPPDKVDPRLRVLRLMSGLSSDDKRANQFGAGVIVSNQGYVVTNLHVVQGAAKVRVYLNDGRVFPGRLVGADRISDIAVLKIEAVGLKALPFGNSDKVRIGQGVFAIGNPMGLQETVTQGIISAKGRRASSEAANEFFQTDAAINRGNSGGPLIDLRGRMIGVTNMLTASGRGIAFAIPSNTVRRVFESIRDHGRFIRPWFGAMAQPLNPMLAAQLGTTAKSGAVIMGTYEGSPAATAGLQPGDVITAYNGKVIIDHIDLRNRVAETPIGKEVTLDAIRQGQPIELDAIIASEPGA